jgi:hypothetical protein
MEKFLPIGSIVLLKGGQKKLMVYGRRQIDRETKKEWDYVSCIYPEGNIDSNHSYLFNHEQIDTIFFTGYQDAEELEFNKFLQGLSKGENEDC